MICFWTTYSMYNAHPFIIYNAFHDMNSVQNISNHAQAPPWSPVIWKMIWSGVEDAACLGRASCRSLRCNLELKLGGRPIGLRACQQWMSCSQAGWICFAWAGWQAGKRWPGLPAERPGTARLGIPIRFYIPPGQMN